jgi:predicted NBD/HSP70 family sugar kinase
LRNAGPVSHTELLEQSGLSSASVSKITGELEAEGVIEKMEDTTSQGRGRPRVQFRHRADAAYFVDVRIVLDKIVFSLVDYAGTLKDRIENKRIFQAPDIDQFAANMKAGLERVLERSGLTRQDIRTISITSKGIVDSSGRVLLWSPVFDHNKIDFQSMLGPDWNATIRITNETQFSAKSAFEFQRRTGKGKIGRRQATLSLGHGVGLGIAELDSTGTVHSFAPAFGHMVHEPDGPLCRCGSRGCIESYAGFYGILRTAFEVPADTIPSKFVPFIEIKRIANAARAGDRRAQHAFNKAGEALGVGISRLITLYEPMPIVITGQGMSLFDLLEPELRYHINAGLTARLGAVPEIKLIEDEVILIHEGNKNTSLHNLDVLFADSTG